MLQTVLCHWQQYTITIETVLHTVGDAIGNSIPLQLKQCCILLVMPLATVYHYNGNSVAYCSLPLVTVYHYNGNSVADCSLPLVTVYHYNGNSVAYCW